MCLRCYSENQIVDELARQGVELDRSNVNRKLKVVQDRQLSNSHNPPDDLQLYNVWKVLIKTNTFGHFLYVLLVHLG